MIDINLTQIITNTIADILTQLPLFILLIWGIKTIVKEMPKWLMQYKLQELELRNMDKVAKFTKELKDNIR